MARTRHPKYTGAIASARIEMESKAVKKPFFNTFAAGLLVYSRDAKHTGRLTGSTHSCSLESCRGWRLGVRWDNGKITYPCTDGMTFRKRSWRII
jgi:hypothetical protein